ncbi:YceD family protein [Geodermatophilus sp. URMC 60]
MPAAPPPRPGAASKDARRPAANPWFVDLRELGRRAGSMHEIERTLPAPADWRVELIGVPEGAEVHLQLRLESVMEGVLVSGEVDVPVVGSCARCLEPIEDSLELDVQELFAYEGSTTEATSEEDEVRRVEGEHLDLEPMVRDLVVLSLPLAPTCTEDCAGLCVDCGQRLDDLPADHTHEQLDPRWAGLAQRFGASQADRFASAPGTPGADNPEEN